MAPPCLLHGLGSSEYAVDYAGFQQLLDSECFAGFVDGGMDLGAGVFMAAMVIGRGTRDLRLMVSYCGSWLLLLGLLQFCCLGLGFWAFIFIFFMFLLMRGLQPLLFRGAVAC